MVELNCESDFVAKGDDFRLLARDLALHIAASNPRWVSRDEVPDDVVEEEQALYQRKAEQDGKPAQAIPKIVEGQLRKFFEDNCLLDQPFVRDQNVRVGDLVAQTGAKVQENIAVRRFSRFSIKEG
jgi:elongation factor Ts